MSRRLPSLSALRAFEAAARLGGAKQAAAELSVTPTAISHQIRKLEDQLGCALFVRRPRQLDPTAEGRALQGALARAFDGIADAVAQVRQPTRRALTLSVTPGVASRWLVPRMHLLGVACPELDLHLQVSHAPVALDGSGADLAIRYGDGRWPGLVSHLLFDNVFAPVCSPALGIGGIGDLRGATLLHFAPAGSVSSVIDWSAWHRLAGLPDHDTGAGPVFSDETHVISAALGGQGVALMSLPLIGDELASGALVQPFGPVIQAPGFHLVYPQRRADDPWIAGVRDWILSLPRPGAP
ncbi:LysR substrate-binding domain-containing protein [Luteimonas deserti]|uniref:LysR family transcriptional regulator n=1 Tax=Luteimonas deserti TaxID=2752306 RepID=A0A7Z0TXG9_9GAMM|nr:LysR substrate-binding domain-containing protein [Luteimonas deserti]NYZ61790.1 LysR family transcriptional regulator [Luteimonas deserti]